VKGGKGAVEAGKKDRRQLPSLLGGTGRLVLSKKEKKGRPLSERTRGGIRTSCVYGKESNFCDPLVERRRKDGKQLIYGVQVRGNRWNYLDI